MVNKLYVYDHILVEMIMNLSTNKQSLQLWLVYFTF